MTQQVELETNATAGDLREGDRFAYVVLSSVADYVQHAIVTRQGFFQKDGDPIELEIRNPSAPVRLLNPGGPVKQSDMMIAVNSATAGISHPVLPDGTVLHKPDDRFIVYYDDGTIHIVNAERAAWLFDMGDTLEVGFRMFYVKKSSQGGGYAVPVTLGEMERCNSEEENPVIYATAPMVADGEIVGRVEYTDH